jgi:hypothetical protein
LREYSRARMNRSYLISSGLVLSTDAREDSCPGMPFGAPADAALAVPMSAIISVAGLSKTYASGFEALKGINLDIRRGEIFALSARTARARRR